MIMFSNPQSWIAWAIRRIAFVSAVMCVLPGAAPCNAHTISTLYAFSGNTDGANPGGGLTLYKGGLFGITRKGGQYGQGTAYRVDEASGAETTLYAIQGGRNGKKPWGAIARIGGALYGLDRTGGGKFAHGAIFEADTKTGEAGVIFRFSQELTEGAYPEGVSSIGGRLVGSTALGGASNLGAVFSFDPATNTETLLHSFSGADGEEPYAPIISHDGVLYGTTFLGGTANAGVVYALAPSTGILTVLYNFQNGSDAGRPTSPLLYYKGLLYGTTIEGGQGSCEGGLGCGAVFSIDPTSGAEKVLYRFKGGESDGAVPTAGLIAVDDKLYSTTSQGGGTKCFENGCGTIFEFDPAAGAETMLYAFSHHDAGSIPAPGALVYDHGAFYGATMRGGRGRRGIVFKFVP
jgi:uncharacterized repeat protein (TIGR03803 family)